MSGTGRERAAGRAVPTNEDLATVSQLIALHRAAAVVYGAVVDLIRTNRIAGVPGRWEAVGRLRSLAAIARMEGQLPPADSFPPELGAFRAALRQVAAAADRMASAAEAKDLAAFLRSVQGEDGTAVRRATEALRVLTAALNARTAELNARTVEAFDRRIGGAGFVA